MGAEKNTGRHRGGTEPPPEAQDRPEQNAGYDEAVRNGKPGETAGTLEADQILEQGGSIEDRTPELPAPRGVADIDDRAERDAVADVRRRERADR